MRVYSYGDITITYPDYLTPFFGVDIYVKIEYTGIGAGWENGTEKSIKVNGVVYKGLVYNKVVYFYFDLPMPIQQSPTVNVALDFTGILTLILEFILILGSWEIRGKRLISDIPLFREKTNLNISIDAGRKMFLKRVTYTGNESLFITTTGRIEPYLDLENSKALYWIEDASNSSAPSPSDVRWKQCKEIRPLCSQTQLEGDKRTQIGWVDRNGYYHFYYFDTLAITEGKGESYSYEREYTIAENNNTAHAELTLNIPKVTKTYVSYPLDDEELKDVITLGSAMIVNFAYTPGGTPYPIDPKKIQAMTINTQDKGLHTVTFNVDFEAVNKNTIKW